jgi:sialidase-1
MSYIRPYLNFLHQMASIKIGYSLAQNATKPINKSIVMLMSIMALQLISCTGKIYKNATADAIKITSYLTVNPIYKRLETNPYLHLIIEIPISNHAVSFRELKGKLNRSAIKSIAKLELYQGSQTAQFKTNQLLGSAVPQTGNFKIDFKSNLIPGTHHLWLSVTLKGDADTEQAIQITALGLKDTANVSYDIQPTAAIKKYTGIALRKPADEGVNTYRIPGMVTTNKGTLVSVYDIRYDHSGDLPANIDVGMSRSTDKGKTWETMKTIMDMGGPKENSGVGDPSILFDPVTNTIWVTALWSKGNHSIAGSGPGLTPEETGQFVITSSTDDGLTWSKPYSITNQVKNPEWRIFFPGPGNGIAMADGKIVFPAQYWDAKKTPHSTLIYSADHGKNWKSGMGAKSNTTESQLVETAAGKLMLNMRDNRGKFRSIATTMDMGQTWTEHHTSYNTLKDPVCMASFIKASVNVNGIIKDVLFFSNMDSKSDRINLTIKASLDMGETWLSANQLLLDDRDSFGYSALTRVDENNLGILYEGVGSLMFLKIPVKDIIQ